MTDKNPLISNVSPPTELPSFILQQQPEEPSTSKPKFVAAIPPQPQQPKVEQPKSEASGQPVAEEVTDETVPSMQDIAQALSPITDGVKNSVLFGWVKDTVKSGSGTFLEKAKQSIDKVVTTLDPQMAQLICKLGEFLQYLILTFFFLQILGEPLRSSLLQEMTTKLSRSEKLSNPSSGGQQFMDSTAKARP